MMRTFHALHPHWQKRQSRQRGHTRYPVFAPEWPDLWEPNPHRDSLLSYLTRHPRRARHNSQLIEAVILGRAEVWPCPKH